MSGFKCLECGHKFRTVKAAERAADDGCPKCGGVDIDLDPKPDNPAEYHRKRIAAADAKMPDAIRNVLYL